MSAMQNERRDAPRAMRGDLLDEEDPLQHDTRARPPRPAGRGPRRWPWVLLFLLLALLLLAGLLPHLASGALVRRAVLARVNAKLAPATLSIDDWTLRWFAAMEVRGVHFSDPARGADVRVGAIATSGGLAGMLPFGKVDLGTVTVDTPQAAVRLPSRLTPAAADTNAPPAPRAVPAIPVKDLALKLVVKAGRLELAGAGEKPFVLEHVGFETALVSLHEPLTVKFATFLPWKDDAGRITVDGTLPAPEWFLKGGTPTPERMDIAVAGFDLESLRDLLTTFAGAPWIRSGTINGQVSLRYRGRSAAQVKAEVTAARLSIEPPGKAPSPAGDVSVLADLDYADGKLAISRLSCRSPWVTAQADGQFAMSADEQGRHTVVLAAKVDADVVAIARDFGNLLGMSDQFKAERGRVVVDAVLAGTPESLEAKFSLTATNLTLRYGQEVFTPQPPPLLRLNVSKPYDGPLEVRELLVELPFARLTGKGAATMSFQAHVDLTAGGKELRRMLASCPAMVGTIDAEVAARPAEGGVNLAATLQARDVAIEASAGRRLALQKGQLAAAAFVPLLPDGRPAPEVRNAQFRFTSEAGEVAGNAARLMLPATNRTLIVEGGQCRVDIDFEAARRFAQPFLAALPPGATLKGKLAANATAEVAGGQAKVRVNAVAQDVQFITTAWDVRDPEVRVTLAADADLAKGQIKVFGTRVIAAAATVDVPAWQVQLPQRGGEGLSMQGSAKGEARLDVIAGWMRPGKDGKPPPHLAGKLAFDVQGNTSRDGVRLTLDAALDGLTLAAAGAKPFAEPHATLRCQASLPADASRVTLDTLALKMSLAELDAKGRVDDLARQRLADLSGALAVDFDQVDKLLRAQGIKYPLVSGRQSRPFAVSGSMAGSPQALLSYGQGQAALYLAAAGAYGLKAGPSDISCALAKGVLRAAYEPALSEGHLSLVPSIEVTSVPMVLSLPPKARVLQNVRLTQEMLDEALVLVVRLLRGCAVGAGTVDLQMPSCRVPLGATLKRDTTFVAALTLKKVVLSPSGTIGAVLDVAGLGGQPLRLDSYEIAAECRDGRVRTSPLKLSVGGCPVILSGSVGLDGTLAYVVEAPLSKKLVGKAAAKYLEGITVRVPIGGTITAPTYDKKALENESLRFVEKALKQAAAATVDDLLKNLRRNR